MVKDVQRAGNIKLQCRRNAGSFRLRLFQQFVVEVAQDRHFCRVGVSKERSVHIPNSAVNDGFFHGLQALFSTDNKLAKGKDKVGFQSKRVVVLAVIEVYIHRVHILGHAVHAFSCWRQAYHLPAQSLHKGKILGFGVADDNIVVGDEKGVCHFPFCRKGFTASRCSKNKPVWVFQLLAVAEYHVIA